MRLRAAWEDFETATARCANVLAQGPAPRLIDDVVVALKDAAQAAAELGRAQARVVDALGAPDVGALAVAQEERRRRFFEIGCPTRRDRQRT